MPLLNVAGQPIVQAGFANVARGGVVAPVALTPDQEILALTPALYLDFGDLATLFKDTARTVPVTTLNDEIKGVTDKSTGARHRSQATTANAPIYKTAVQNSRSVGKLFNAGILSWLDGDWGSGASAAHVFVVLASEFDPPGSASHVSLWTPKAAGFDSTYPWTDGVIYEAWGTDGRHTTGNPAVALTTFRIYEIEADNTVWTSRFDGTTHYTTATNTFAMDSAGALGRSTGGVGWAGQIAALVNYPSRLSAPNAATVRAALKTIWATPLPQGPHTNDTDQRRHVAARRLPPRERAHDRRAPADQRGLAPRPRQADDGWRRRAQLAVRQPVASARRWGLARRAPGRRAARRERERGGPAHRRAAAHERGG